MMKLIDLHAIIKLKERGMSNRKVADQLGVNKDTVAKYWNRYQANIDCLDKASDSKEVQELIVSKPKYNTDNRTYRKYNEHLDRRIDEILHDEKIKLIELGWDKQRLSTTQIHEIVVSEGFDIGLSTVSNHVRDKRKKLNECYIRQHYEYGERLEFDFGEVKLLIDGVNVYGTLKV